MKISMLFFLLTTGFSGGMYAQSTVNSTTVDAAIQELTSNQAGNGNARAIGSFVSFHGNKEDTKGSRFFFKDWVKGSIVNVNDVVVNSDKLLFNFDKISSNIFLTNQQEVVEVGKDQIKSFVLRSNGNDYAFVRVETVKPDVFFQVLIDPGTKYGLYVLTTTSFKKADFHTDGLVETGSNYDEYVDTKEYYVVSPGSKDFKKIELKKKRLKEAFPAASLQVKAFLSTHGDDPINEGFIVGLVNAVNQ